MVTALAATSMTVRLEDLGAGRGRQVHSWQVMCDPPGMPSCVIPEPAGAHSDGSAQCRD